VTCIDVASLVDCSLTPGYQHKLDLTTVRHCLSTPLLCCIICC